MRPTSVKSTMGKSNKPSGSYPSDDDPRWAHLSENAKGVPTYAEKIAESLRASDL